MISNVSGAALPHLRPASTPASNAASGLQPVVPDATDAATSGFRIDVSQVKPLSGAKVISAADNPHLRDLLATNWLRTHDASATQPLAADNAPENTYAQVKVDGKVVATLYNGGSSVTPRVTSNSSGCGQSNSSTREAGQGTVSLSLFPGQELQRLL
ncbi:hypothetical protein ABIF91_003689 [Bradyrhizobium sp. USDA 241]